MPKPVHQWWRITLIRTKGHLVGYVEAPTEAAAIKAAIELWGITDQERQSRLVAQPLAKA